MSAADTVNDRPHRCPWCRCNPDTVDHMGRVDKKAPMYHLVELVMAASDGR